MLNRVVLSLALFTLACLAGDLNGKWAAKAQTPDGPMDVTYDFKVEDGKVSGSLASPMGEFKITDGVIKDDEVTFILNVVMEGETHKIEHKGKLSGDSLTLRLEFNGSPMEIHAKRQ